MPEQAVMATEQGSSESWSGEWGGFMEARAQKDPERRRGFAQRRGFLTLQILGDY